MAKKPGVWGIDIGQCALKALRCVPGDLNGKIHADKFDFIEYPKMLNQPEADPDELVSEALQQFMSRNDVVGDRVCICVPGQTGLSRFFRPPPVDVKTLPDIVKFEVKQQIPFPLEDVIWDWQQMGGIEVDGRVVDAEVGLFAMKREAVFRALKPFDDHGIIVDLVQLSPLSVFNYVLHDVFDVIPNPKEFDPENPPDSMVVLSMGTDTTDLVVTNGIKLWMRNIAVGGNHFTKQLSREMKLTHAKAEQFKRNARQAEDPKAVFKAMRPVFNDLVNEIQRSLTFFQGVDKTARVTRMVLLGNSAKLPGLRQFLNTQLGLDIVKVSEFKKLEGEDVVQQATFSDNLLSFAPAYGLCVQGMNRAQLGTNLLPREIRVDRIIDAKKPWTLAAVSVLLLGMLVSYVLAVNAWWRVNDEFAVNEVPWSQVTNEVQDKVRLSKRLVEADDTQRGVLEKVNRLNRELVSASENKTTWIELQSALNQALPRDERIAAKHEAGEWSIDPFEIPFEDRRELYIEHVDTLFARDVATWWKNVKSIYLNQFEVDISQADITKFREAQKAAEEAVQDNQSSLTGPGWIVEIRGRHYHNSRQAMVEKREAGRAFVLATFIDHLRNGELVLPGEDNEVEGGGVYKYEDFGILYPTIVRADDTPKDYIIEYSRPRTVDAEGTTTTSESSEQQGSFKVKKFEFVVQLVWVPRTPAERYKAREERLAKEKAAADAAANPAASNPSAATQDGGDDE
ncbi:MAG TPA: type IV pilus assembly protein PilM [Pirellulaceae bacterium]|nr:type IV pilus assembly protein PilM [Pirellulaceae bacterium]